MLKKYLITGAVLGMLLLSACGEKEELNVFKDNMTTFYTEVSNIESEISSINEQSENAVETLLIKMEQLSEQFEQLAELEIPEEFGSVEELADDASDYMKEAVRLYEEAYEEDYVSDSLIQAAAENYECAMKRINYIASLLQNEIPEGATLIQEDGTDFEPYTGEE